MADFAGAHPPGSQGRFDDLVSGRTLVFVDGRGKAAPSDASTDIVVLDATWTPEPEARPDVLPIRPTLQDVLREVDLFGGTLTRLDAWADAASLADRFMIDGISWWDRVRMIIRWDVHELLLWRSVLDRLAPPGRYATVVIPDDRPALIAAARAAEPVSGPRVVVARTLERSGRGWVRATFRRVVGTGVRRRLRDFVDRVGPRRSTWGERTRRSHVLEARLDRLVAGPPEILTLASVRAFQKVGSGAAERYVDPNLAPVLTRLTDEGSTVATVALAVEDPVGTDWRRIADDDRLVPLTSVRARYERAGDASIDASDTARAVASMGDIPLPVGETDLGPAVRAVIEGYTGSWLDGQRRWSTWAERLLRDLAPRTLLVDREGSRTLWMAAARRLGIPIVAVQHGVIYPDNPEYCHASHRGLLLPDTTCVFGTYERDVLVDIGGFAPASVVVTGSARIDPSEGDLDGEAAGGGEERAAVRAAVRSELGVADGDRLLVVSVANNPVGGDIHSVCMVARLLDGPLPGIHVVVKLHPIDQVVGRYEGLFAGLARAGGFPPPPLTVVRDIDLYRLLRAADAHLGQYSTVLTDAVVAGTPNMIAVGVAFNDHIGYVGARVATPVVTIDDVRAFMADPRQPDPADRARFLGAHSRAGDAAGRIAATVRAAMTGPREGATA